MKVTTLIALTVCALSAAGAEDEAVDVRVRETRSISLMIDRLRVEAERCHQEAGPMPDLRAIVGSERSLDELARAAIILHGYASPQPAGYARFDDVFDAAQWECVRQIASRPGRDAELTLVYLRPIIARDGGPALLFIEAIESQERVTKAAQPGATDNPGNAQ